MRGTLADVHPVLRAVLHALELAGENLDQFCGDLTDAELNYRPSGLPSVAFHIKHIARSLDRLLTYAEGNLLTEDQKAASASEHEPASRKELFTELHLALSASALRIRRFDTAKLDETRLVGRKRLPSTLAGLLVHVADHTQRHVGQAVTTTKLIISMRK